MTLSIGILSYTLNDTFKAMTDRCIASFAPFADELIVVENGGSYTYDANLFIKYKQNQGYTKGVNAILKNATGDYIAFVSNDTQLLKGDFRSLCIPDTVTSPVVAPLMAGGLSGAIFCIPRPILEKVGYLDERMVLRYSDTAYFDRILSQAIATKQVEGMDIFHTTSTTVSQTLHMAVDDEMHYYNNKGEAQ